jgi:rhodanese-related sulfurtransferase
MSEHGRKIVASWAFAAIGAIVSIWPGRGVTAEPPGKNPNLSPAEARELIRAHTGDPRFVLLDVRTHGEFVEERIEGATPLDFRSPAFREGASRLDRKRKYLVYCRTGNRSAGALKVLEELGFANVYHLAGGLTKWKAAGLPTVK